MKILRLLAHPKIVFLTFPFLIVTLIAGTVAQRFIGLYEAQEQFFFSFIAWIGPIPIPGTLSLLFIVVTSLLAKFIFFSPWKLKYAGIHLAHLGALIMIIGGGVTLAFKQEGQIFLLENSAVSIIQDVDYPDRSYNLRFKLLC